MAAMALKAADVPVMPTDGKRAFDPAFVTSFIVILIIALASQMLTLKWRPWFPGAESEKSLIGGVRAAVSSFLSLPI